MEDTDPFLPLILIDLVPLNQSDPAVVPINDWVRSQLMPLSDTVPDAYPVLVSEAPSKSTEYWASDELME